MLVGFKKVQICSLLTWEVSKIIFWWLLTSVNYIGALQEMNLLMEAEQPGNHVDDYISKLNSVLSQKAAGILKLQSQLASFKRRLNDNNVLVSAPRYWFHQRWSGKEFKSHVWYLCTERSSSKLIYLHLWSLWATFRAVANVGTKCPCY